MAIVAYASADPNPIVNPSVDVEHDLALVALPQTQQVFGDGIDSLDAFPVWTFSWTILDSDPSVPATLSSAVAQNPDITVSTWRNARLFLIVTNTNSGNTSEADPRLAPDTAFVTVRVRSADGAIQKPAATERNYEPVLHEWADAIEAAAGGIGAHAFDSAAHTDASPTVTGANLATLTDGSNATGLHGHDGPDVAVATALARGTVTLEETGAGAAKVITRERVAFAGSVDTSRTATGGLYLGQIVPHTYEADTAIGVDGRPLLAWRAEFALKVRGYAVTMVDGGKAAPVHPYRFRLATATAVQAAAGAWVDLGGATETTGAPTSDGRPLCLATTFAEIAIAAGEYVALFCLAAPRILADAETPGGGLTAQIFARREVT